MGGTELLVNLAGGVALLLWGVRMVKSGMTRAFGALLRQALAIGTQNRVAAFGMGLLVTGILQSSTATCLIIGSFASRNLVTLPAALAVMLGADVGSTVAAQVLSFDLGWVSSLLIAAGAILFLSLGGDRGRQVGRIMVGLGLMLLSLRLIAGASAPLRDSPSFALVLGPIAAEPLLGVIFGTLVTWLFHSSLATVLIVASLAAHGVVPPIFAVALVLGANLGGALVPYIAMSASPPPARRVPLGNLVVRGIGVVLVLPFLRPLLGPLALLDADPARLAINFHTVFNFGLALLALPLVDLVATLCRRLLPEASMVEDPGVPRYLDSNLMEQPSEALACAARETLNLGDAVMRMLKLSMDVLERNDARLMKQVEQSDDAVDRLHEAIKLYLIRLSGSDLGEDERRRYVEILTFTMNLEHVGDIIDKNLMELAGKKIKNRYTFSPEGLRELQAFHARVLDNMKLAMNVFMSSDLRLARRLLAEKIAIRDAELAAAESHFGRLREGRPQSIETSAIHMDIIRDLKRINSHLTSVAYPILEAHGELGTSRLRAAGAVAAEAREVPHIS